jgi:hypothetical protein
MRSERLAVYTTVYPAVAPYLAEWYRSVLAQTDRDFTLWMGLHGVEPDDVVNAIGQQVEARWVPVPASATPAQVRSAALMELLPIHDAVVFVDSDDVLMPTRIETARAALQSADVAGCALAVMDTAGRDLAVTFGAPEGDDAAELLPRYNVFGLSNTAYRAETLRRCLPTPDDCLLYDWLLATRAWTAGATLAFDATPQMRYRQYAANTAPMLPPFTGQQVLTASGRVLNHYDLMLDDSWRLPPAHQSRLDAERRRVRRFDTAMRSAPETLQTYVEQLNQLPPLRVWWWQVAHPDLEFLWTN